MSVPGERELHGELLVADKLEHLLVGEVAGCDVVDC